MKVRGGGRVYLKYLKREWNRKKGRGNKDLKKGGGKMMLLNYKNDPSTNVSKYYRLAIYIANTKHFCGNSIL